MGNILNNTRNRTNIEHCYQNRKMNGGGQADIIETFILGILSTRATAGGEIL